MTRARLPMHGYNHLPGGSDPIPGLSVGTAFRPFSEAVLELTATRDLRGYWRLGDGASPFLDTSNHPYGPAHAVKTSAGTAMTDSITGYLPTDDDDGAVQFNSANGGTGDYLDCPDPTGPASDRRFNFDSGDEAMSIAAIVSPIASGTTFTGITIGEWADAGFGNCGWRLGVMWPARTAFFQRRAAGSGAPSVTVLSSALPTGEGSFLAATYNATAGHRLYVNGALVGSDPTTFTGLPSFNSGPLIGRNGAGSDFESFYGGVDEISVWGGTLSASDIATLANSGGLITESTLDSLVTTSGAYTLTSADDVVFGDRTLTLTLPTAIGLAGKRFVVKNVGTATVTITAAGTETIDAAGGPGTIALTTTKSAVMIISDGSGWQKIGGYSYP